MSHQQTSDFKLKSHKQLVKWTNPLHRGIKDILWFLQRTKKVCANPKLKRGSFATDINGLPTICAQKLGPPQSQTLNVYGLFPLVLGKVLGVKLVGKYTSPIVWEMGPKWQDYRWNWVETRRFCWATASQQLADQSPWFASEIQPPKCKCTLNNATPLRATIAIPSSYLCKTQTKTSCCCENNHVNICKACKKKSSPWKKQIQPFWSPLPGKV